jgi:hypothetical protein
MTTFSINYTLQPKADALQNRSIDTPPRHLIRARETCKRRAGRRHKQLDLQQLRRRRRRRRITNAAAARLSGAPAPVTKLKRHFGHLGPFAARQQHPDAQAKVVAGCARSSPCRPTTLITLIE